MFLVPLQSFFIVCRRAWLHSSKLSPHGGTWYNSCVTPSVSTAAGFVKGSKLGGEMNNNISPLRAAKAMLGSVSRHGLRRGP